MALLYKVIDTATGKPKYSPTSVVFAQETPTGVVNGTNTDFVMAFTPVSASSVHFYLDGLLLKQTAYSVNLGTKTVTLSTPPALAQDVYVSYVR